MEKSRHFLTFVPMKFDVSVLYQGRRFSFRAEEGAVLLDLLRENKIPVSSPCGGRGLCGKCNVEIVGVGEVKACTYHVQDHLEVVVPTLPGMQILQDSYWPDWLSAAHPEDQDSGAGGYGVAVDIGTTTVVVFLEDLAKRKNTGVRSFVNPQQAYGADVISRIQYCRENENGVEKLQELVVQGIKSRILELCGEAGVAPDAVKEMSVVGNTTMLHIFKGVNPAPLAEYPFTPVFTEMVEMVGMKGMEEFQGIRITLLPSVSAYVGADIVAGIAALDWPEGDEQVLFLDIGTNGEMARIDRNGILVCATAAGPAFEGAKISCGTGGVAGAVFKMDSNGFQTINDQSPVGLCGSGLLDAVVLMLDRGVVDTSGYLEDDYVLIPENRKGVHPAISLTPQDIREVQLAKGAIAAGIEVLLKKSAITLNSSIFSDHSTTLPVLYLAGGFGYALDPDSAGRIGLIPEALSERVIRVGNTAALGARLYLHEPVYRERLNRIVQQAEYIELSGDMEFNELFVQRMALMPVSDKADQ